MKLIAIVIMTLTLLSVTSLQAAQTPPPAGKDLGSVSGGVFNEAHLVIDNKCLKCHTGTRIEEALSAGKDMQMIQQRMEQKGAKLTTDEKSALRIFWRETPLRQKK